MTTSSSNPATDTVGAGTGSKNQVTFCKAFLGFVEFYPCVKGTVFLIEIVPTADESYTEACRRVKKEIQVLLEDDRRSTWRTNTNLSTEGYRVSYVDAVKINDNLFLPLESIG